MIGPHAQLVETVDRLHDGTEIVKDLEQRLVVILGVVDAVTFNPVQTMSTDNEFDVQCY
jgi:hypothetical protein